MKNMGKTRTGSARYAAVFGLARIMPQDIDS